MSPEQLRQLDLCPQVKSLDSKQTIEWKQSALERFRQSLAFRVSTLIELHLEVARARKVAETGVVEPRGAWEAVYRE